MTLYEQWLTFFAMGVCGILMGIYYDGLRELSRTWPAVRRWQAVWDGLFWLGSLLLVVTALWMVNQGVFRWHVLLGLMAGTGLYGWLFSRGVRRFFQHLYRLLAVWTSRLVWFVRRFVITPLLFIGKGTVRVAHFFMRWSAGIYSGIAKIVKRK